MRLNPKAGFAITAKKGWTLTPKERLDATGNASLYHSRSTGRWQLGPRRSASRAPKGGVQGIVQRYYDLGGGLMIDQVYSRKYNLHVGTENLLAVRAEGQRGWLTVEGRFIGEDDFRKLLHSIDRTTVGGVMELTGLSEGIDSGAGLMDLWDSLRPAEKAAVVDALRNIDWDQFWVDFYPRARLTISGGRVKRQRLPGSDPMETENQISMLDDIVMRIAEALGKIRCRCPRSSPTTPRPVSWTAR